MRAAVKVSACGARDCLLGALPPNPRDILTKMKGWDHV